VCDNFSSHFADYVDKVVDDLNIIRVALPRYSPDLNPIEQIWKSLKRDLSPRDAPDLDSYREHICDIFHDYSRRLSFAEAWIERFLNIQKL
jgi:transposase